MDSHLPRDALATVFTTQRRRWLADPAVWQGVLGTDTAPDHLLTLRRGTIAGEFPFAASFSDRALQELPPLDALTDLQRAADRIALATERGEPVAICGDYDVDGTSACALLDRFFRHYNLSLKIHIPNRLTEGYGLSPAGVDLLADQGVRVIVTVDNGIAAHEACQRARERGVDVIITDHHEPGAQLPEAFAVVNPKRRDCSFPYKSLAGVGVAFYLCMALRRRLTSPADRPPIVLRRFLDLVAIGTIADVCPLTGLNHMLTRIGLDELRGHLSGGGGAPGRPRVGLAALAAICGVDDTTTLTAETIAFQMGPRLNAAGRLGTAWAAYRIMATNNPAEGAELARQLNEENLERRSLERAAATSVAERLAADPDGAAARGLVLFDPSWHPGILGIVAARCVERYYVPTMVFTEWEGVLKGSGRSTEDVDLFALLAPHSRSWLAFGGHPRAVGLTLARTGLEDFRDCFLAGLKASHELNPHPKLAPLRIDGVVTADMLNLDFARTMAELEPFGAGNPRPTLAIKDAVVASIQPMGRRPEDGHCTVTLAPAGRSAPGAAGGLRITAFGQRQALESAWAGGRRLHMALTLSESSWRGTSRAEARLVDFGRADD